MYGCVPHNIRGVVLTITSSPIRVQSVSDVTAAGVGADGVVTVLSTLVSKWRAIWFRTLIDIYRERAAQFVNLGLLLLYIATGESIYNHIYTITTESIIIESVSKVTAAGVGADGVVTVLVTAINALSTLINVCEEQVRAKHYIL